MKQQTYYAPRPNGETAFTVTMSNVKFGAGCLAELGEDARALGLKRVAFFTDRNVVKIEGCAAALESLRRTGVDVAVYDAVKVEPTDKSFLDAARFAQEGRFDGYVSLGGGSVMDTCKAANLLATWPDDLFAYVNAPLGRGTPIPGPVRPHIACPTTAGTGSETTGAAIFDMVEKQVKTGISHKFLRPLLAVVDPATTYSLPAGVVASTAFDVLTHAIESYTARPFTDRDRPAQPSARPPYQGANPWSDIGSTQAMKLGGKYLERAYADPEDREARDALMFASTLAGLAFGNAGVHIPHSMSYAVAGMNHTYVAKGYENANPMVPHGISVVINAPAAFRFTAPACPERHLEAAAALGADVRNAAPQHGGEILAKHLEGMMRRTGLPSGIAELGYTEKDVPAMAKGAFAQQRLLVHSPRPVGEGDLAELFRAAMRYW
jgi:alcohol dehydrogenase class IV